MLGRLWREVALPVAAAVSVGVAVGTNVGGFAVIEGRSMQPTLNASSDHEVALVSKLCQRRQSALGKGDVVVFRAPFDPSLFLVKRITGTAHEIRFSRVTGREREIPAGHVWVEGDNPLNSHDSNYFGPIPLGLVLGKLVCVVWPLAHLRLLHPPAESPASV